MLRLTQSHGQGHGYFGGVVSSSTRNQKQVASINGQSSIHSHEKDDFLKKVKLQQQTGKGTKELVDMQRRNTEKPVSGGKGGAS